MADGDKAQGNVTGADIRAKLDHPVVDGDSHIVEFGPVLNDYLKMVGGADMPKRLGEYRKNNPRPHRDIWWSRPSGDHTGDTAAAMLPRLLRDRLDQIGIDFSILYSSAGLGAMHIRDAEIRQALHRALNTMYADIFTGTGDRMTPSAVIPTYTPDEAVAELEYCVETLGLKAATVNSEVRLPAPEVEKEAPHLANFAIQVHGLGLESLHDYDPFWKRCVELGVAPACHTKTMGGGSTRSARGNFVFNHLGSFASGSEFLCRSVFMGGVPKRFPGLNFQFLEGNASWALGLYNDICEHFEKRNLASLKRNLNPHTLDVDMLEDAFAKYGDDKFMTADQVRAHPYFAPDDLDFPEAELDEFRDTGIRRMAEIREIFEKNFYIGCEADDRMASCAFNRKLHHGGARLNATLSSDLGHWDVVDMLGVLPETYEMVEDGLMSPDDFRDFSFENVVRCVGGMNPDFFKGTVVEDAAAKVISAAGEN